jgi:glucans biosynthesis protein
VSFERIALSRRQIVKGFLGFAVLSATTSLTPIGFAEDTAPGTPFSFDDLTAQMKALAAKPFVPADAKLPDFLAKLSYDAYRRIGPRPDRALKLSDGFGYKVEPFHMGWLFKEPVLVFDTQGDTAKEIQFTAADFDYHDPATADAMAEIKLPGVAGLRIDYPVNAPTQNDELVAFLGASYFRALGRGNAYGASARGVVIDSWLSGPEEFPRFSSFYLTHAATSEPLTAYATLEGPSIAGAFEFVFDPAKPEGHQETFIDVTARFFFRSDIAEIGVAPLTSMFLYADVNRSAFDDFRPRVHDSNGLYTVSANGDVAWRALNNPPSLGNSYFTFTNPKAFGLMQRGRDFDHYQDAGARYDLRPSILVEPKGNWGEGSIRLIESTAKLEAEDNIGVFWVPKVPFKAGDSAEFSYRLTWGDLNPDPDGTLAYVLETRSGHGGVSGVENKETLRKFVVDFKGGPLLDPNIDPKKIDVVATIAGGRVVYSAVSPLPDPGVFRLAIDAEIDSKDPIELRAYLVGEGRQLTETWLYQWRAA